MTGRLIVSAWKQGKKEKHRGNQLDCKPEFHRNTDESPRN